MPTVTEPVVIDGTTQPGYDCAPVVEIDGEVLTVTSPEKVMFPEQGWTKRDLVDHFLTCADGALAGVFGRPTMLKRLAS